MTITYDTIPDDGEIAGNTVPGLLPSVTWPPSEFGPPVDILLMHPSISQWACDYWYSRSLAPKWDWLFRRDMGNIRLSVRAVENRVAWDRLWSWLLGDDDVQIMRQWR